MKIINDILYLEKADVLAASLTTERYLWKINNKQQRGWMAITDPYNGKNILVPFTELNKDNQKKYIDACGNPYEAMASKPIFNMLVSDVAALDFFRSKDFLEPRTVIKYTRAAEWLNMLKAANEDTKGIIKGKLGIQRIPVFYSRVGEMIGREVLNGNNIEYNGLQQLPSRFPTSYLKVMEKIAKYKVFGYESIIDPRYGNKSAAKIGKTEAGYDQLIADKQMAAIRAVAAKHNNFDAATVNKLVSPLFTANGWQTISNDRVYQILQPLKATLMPGREGKRAYNNKVAMQVTRKRPDFPTAFFSLDGWTVELLFQEDGSYSNRLVMVVVMDAMNNYPVGYAIGERENTELIKQACRNAILHLKELFGDYYQPYQLQSDHYGIKTLTPFYSAMGHIVMPAAVGNAKAKPVEPYFNYLNKNYCQLHPNWSGHNITARKENQVNSEFLDKIKKTFPTREGVMSQIHAMMQTDRMKKVGEYMEAWERTPDDRRNAIEYMGQDWLMMFGEPVGKTNQISGQGIIKQIDNVKYIYDSFSPSFRQKIHLDWQLISDPYDRSTVLAIAPDGKQKELLHTKRVPSMDLRDMTPADHQYLSAVDNFNNDRREEITHVYAGDYTTVQEMIRSTPLALDTPESTAIKLMFTHNGQQKEGLQDAKGLKQAQAKQQRKLKAAAAVETANWQAVQSEYLSSKTDFNQYLD